MTVPDKSIQRRIAYLERRMRELELQLARRMDEGKRVIPLFSHLWRFQLNEVFDAQHYANADLKHIQGTDTNKDVEAYDVLNVFEDMGMTTDDEGLLLEQIDYDGTTLYVPIVGFARKCFCRFELGGALTTSTASQSATLTDQWGPGADHTDTSITVYNTYDHTDSSYIFEGDSGDAGLACWQGSADSWRIYNMECP